MRGLRRAELLGENQLAIARLAQAVALRTVLDQQLAPIAQQLATADARGRRRLARRFGVAHRIARFGAGHAAMIMILISESSDFLDALRRRVRDAAKTIEFRRRVRAHVRRSAARRKTRMRAFAPLYFAPRAWVAESVDAG